MKKFFSISEVADMLSVSKETLRRWDKSGKLSPMRHPINEYRVYAKEDLRKFENLGFIFNDKHERKVTRPNNKYSTIELFAGAGGLALGLEKSGLECLLLNEIDKNACATLRANRPQWNVVEGDIRNVSFKKYRHEIDILTGGFPCQAFSYAGKKLGLEDTRGTMFYEFARAVNETRPLIAVGENVRGLLNHDSGRTLATMVSILQDIGYNVLSPRVMKAMFYRVPQKRERLLIVAIRKDANINFKFPEPFSEIYTVRDALKSGKLFDSDVPKSGGQSYPKRKREIMELVPQGGYWRDLPLDIQKEFMLKSFYLGGGKTGMARRMSWDEPSLTLTCNPAQKQTERCHPEETRPFTVREYARIQTFPDDWHFAGSISSQYKQIGNAVPVNMAYEIGQSIVSALNDYYSNVVICENNAKVTA